MKIQKNILNILPFREENKKVLNRRINKFIKDPKGFLHGSYNKRSTQIVSKIPIKYRGDNNFTVISAAYNVEKYLDDYFQSFIDQSLNFKRHIYLVVVDDGSTDSSASIIKKWQSKFPKNIRYVYKENGGQASARNLGMQYADTDWVTFIDPDDFIDINYFRFLDGSIVRNPKSKMFVTNLKFYNENQKLVKDTHPLKFRFNNKESIDVISLDKNINLSASSTFFSRSIIEANSINFNSCVKPNFEDGKFIADYLFYIINDRVSFVKDSVYFYRKRGDRTSTLDTAWQKKEKFTDVFIHGFIPMLKMYKENLGFVPKNIQKTALYDMNWYIQYLLNKPEKIGFLSLEDKNIFYNLFLEVFDYIDEDTIMEFGMAGVWFFQKLGMLHAFKRSTPPFQIAYIENIDRDKKQILINVFSNSESLISFQLNGKDSIPLYYKEVAHNFNEKAFVLEVRSWVAYEKGSDVIDVFINNEKSRLSLNNKHFHDGLVIQKIIQGFEPSRKYISDSSWLLMDRETKADDNAEHFYRYLMANHPEQLCYFALNKNSIDWQRLEEEGFKLVEFGTEQFEYHLRKSSKVISSHLEKHINNYFGDQYEYSKKFIFLQHGVTKDDLSSWINSKKNIRLLITTTFPEYRSFVEKNSNYKLTQKEVVLTGFPRHDNLLAKNHQNNKIILIMPTWRNNIMGEVVGIGSNTRTINEDFMQTNYAKHWYDFMHSKELEVLVKNYNYKIIFAPHANIEPYLSMFELPTYINLWQSNTAENSMQQLFQQAKLMITDYSSVAFEMGILNKTTLYYQFDKDEFFSGSHTYQQGYFSYEEDGFGPIVTEKAELLLELEKVLDNDGEPLEPYVTRMRDTFAYRDMNNCERVYQAIIELDQPETKKLDIDILYDMTISAIDNEAWELAESRSLLLIEHSDKIKKIEAQEILYKALFNQNKFTELLVSLESHNRSQNEINYWKAKIAYVTTNWREVIKLLSSMTTLDKELKFMLLFSYAKKGKVDEFEKLKKELEGTQLDEIQSIVIRAWSLCLYEQWQVIIDLLENELLEFDVRDLKEYQPEILIAQAYRHLLEYQQAHNQLASFESHTKNDPRCRIEIARLAYSRDNYEKCIDQYYAAVNGNIKILPQSAIYEYILSLWNMDNIDAVVEMLPAMMELYPDNVEFRLIYIKILAHRSLWKDILEELSKLEKENREDIIYLQILAKYRLGLIEEAYENSIKPTLDYPYEYWSLVGEIALLVEDTELAKYCYKGMIAIYPDQDISKNWVKFNSLKSNM